MRTDERHPTRRERSGALVWRAGDALSYRDPSPRRGGERVHTGDIGNTYTGDIGNTFRRVNSTASRWRDAVGDDECVGRKSSIGDDVPGWRSDDDGVECALQGESKDRLQVGEGIPKQGHGWVGRCIEEATERPTLDEVEYARPDHRDAEATSPMGSGKDHRAASPAQTSSSMAGSQFGAWVTPASWVGEASSAAHAMADGGKQEPERQPTE